MFIKKQCLIYHGLPGFVQDSWYKLLAGSPLYDKECSLSGDVQYSLFLILLKCSGVILR